MFVLPPLPLAIQGHPAFSAARLAMQGIPAYVGRECSSVSVVGGLGLTYVSSPTPASCHTRPPGFFSRAPGNAGHPCLCGQEGSSLPSAGAEQLSGFPPNQFSWPPLFNAWEQGFSPYPPGYMGFRAPFGYPFSPGFFPQNPFHAESLGPGPSASFSAGHVSGQPQAQASLPSENRSLVDNVSHSQVSADSGPPPPCSLTF